MSAEDPVAPLTRRELLAAAGGTAALVTAGTPAGGAAPGAPPSPATAAAPFELAGLGIAELQRGMEEGRWSARRLVELYSERIAAVDRSPGSTNAVAELDPEATAIADARDRERREKGARGPLHGIPVLLKDNIDTGDRMKTTAGSLALAESTAPRDAFLVERLRAAGAVVLGKANLSEWANFRSTRSTSGWSGRGGQVRNPYALDRNPCGSSSGSAVAAAVDLCAVAVGTETDGSITCPASMNGIVGIKPTVGLVSRSGVIPISHTQDTAGPMARTVADAAILLGALVGVDPRDPATAAAAGRVPADFRSCLDPEGLKGRRLGVARDLFGWHPEVDRQMAEVLATLARLGAELVDPAEIPHVRELDAPELEVLLFEFKADLEAYLGGLPDRGQPRTLAGLIAFNERHAAAEMPWFGQEIFHKAAAKGPLTEKAYLDALATCRRLSRAEGLDAAFAGRRLDALVCPTMGPAYLTDWLTGDHFTGSATTPSAVSGYPHLTVPAGFVAGLPWGLSFLGPAWSEPTLVRCAYAFEQATTVRRPPRFLATADLL